MDSKRRGGLVFWLLLVGMFALLPVAWLLFLRSPPPPPPPPPAGPDAALVQPDAAEAVVEDLKIIEITGTVRIRRGNTEYVDAELGTVVRVDDAIKTDDGRARLAAKDAYEVQVEPGTEVKVDEITESISRVKLGSGMVVAKVDGRSGKKIEVAAAGSDAVASSKDGTFAMSNDGKGTVAVGSRAGEVEFSAAGKAVLLRAGQQSVSRKGAPSEPAPIPSSLFLKVDWPTGQIAKAKVSLSGRTAPGALVRIEGEAPVVTALDGRFALPVKLREGRHPVHVEAVDLGGNRAPAERTLDVDTTAPDSAFRTGDLWKK